MQAKVKKTLEYDKILTRLSGYANCCVGRELCAALEPAATLPAVRKRLDATAEAVQLLYGGGRLPVDDFPDMRATLGRMHAALYLSPAELLDVAKCLRAIRLCRDMLCGAEESRTGQLASLASGLLPHRSIEEEIDRCILGEEDIADSASPALSRIRRSMRLANSRVREKLNGMIHSAAYQKYLQEPLVTIRNGRFVLPVKQEYRQQVPGLIHDQSGSGATLFIEPNAVVELGNEYKKLLGEETEEIERILAELTALVAPYAEDILEDLNTLGEIDLVFARAQLSLAWRGVNPKLNEAGPQGGYIRIVQGRHPLIDPACVAPIDLWIGRENRVLIITGPNTGGKTVTLKTVGLFALLTQAGIFIPANEGSEMAVFDAVYADIGDEQSIEQSLSTFSSHMRNIVEVLAQLDGNALVLLDELGAGTDPTEGAALAMSILETLLKRGCLCAATTHYSEVKAFALTREGMENASMEFDVDRLCPTYRLILGIPGKSNAFEISSRLGLPADIIQNARTYLTGEDVQFEDIISGAQAQHRIAQEERAMAEEARAELERLRAETAREKRRMEEERGKLLAKAREEARRLVADAKADMDKLAAQLRAVPGIDRSAADRAIQSARDTLRAKQNELAEPMAQKAEDGGEPPRTVRPGDTVRVLSVDKKATVLSAPDAKGEVAVQAGIIKMNVALADLRLLQEKEAQRGAAKVTLSQKTVGLELDVRGMLVDDAQIVVDRYLEDAAMAGLNEVNIIHGKGTGALRAGLQAHFRKHPRVKSFRMGNYGEGDAGVTVVTLKK